MALTQTFNQDAAGDIVIAGAVSTAAPSYTNGSVAAMSLTLTGLLRVDGSGVTQPISASTLPLPTGASTSALQTTINNSLLAISAQLPATLGQKLMAASLAVVISSDQSAIPVSGTVTVANSTYAQGSTTSGQLGGLSQGAATAAAPTYTTATTNPLSLTLAGALRTDSSATTQPVSAASLPLPTGAATAANQATEIASLASIDGKLPSLGAHVIAGSIAVNIASDQVVPVIFAPSTTATLTSVSGSITSVTLLASNSSRKSFVVFNDSTAILYVACAASASTTAFTQKLQPGSSYTADIDYTGIITGIFSSATGAARMTEFT